ncbi:phage baseplate plug family protein [Levilactobacillus wangkuiensis]|uniref:phage baseplate plug family protein n=1 Tax=Levilactobacillus wangkuiensis TaxID=2799566 RepID=UPI00194F7DFC|nr:hypothetical protein [Levilactobacillus wangkuiensis]
MPKRDSIIFDLNNLPDRQEIEFENGVFDLTLQYNDTSHIFTIDMVSIDDETHQILGEPLTYGVPLWYWASYDWLPPERLVPMDEAGLQSSITLGNFQDSTFILDDSLDEEGDDDGS